MYDVFLKDHSQISFEDINNIITQIINKNKGCEYYESWGQLWKDISKLLKQSPVVKTLFLEWVQPNFLNCNLEAIQECQILRLKILKMLMKV